MRGAVLALTLAFVLSGCALFKRDEDKAAGNAQAPTIYDLDIEASPRDVRALLQEHLDVARYQRWPDEDLSSAELTRLAQATPAQARALLETEGYFNPEVLVTREPGQVTVKVTAGPRAVVGEVALLDDDKDLPEATRAAWRRAWTLPAGEPFTQARWSTAKAALLTRASADGYPQARWDRSEAVVDAERNRVGLDLTLAPGPRYRLGELRIEGLKHHDEETVRRLAGFAPGDLYDERTLLNYQERLAKTQLFDSASVELVVEPLRPDQAGQPPVAPVLVRLREAPRKQATTGIGYDANTGQRITLEYLDRLPLGYPLRARGKLILGRDLRSAELELSTHPKEDLTRNLASLQFEQDRSGGQDISNLSARLGRLREKDAQDERLVYTELLRSRETQASGPAITGEALSANIQWIRRRLDSLLLPTEGHQGFLLLGAGRAQNSVADSGSFGKVHLKLYGYRPIGSNWYGNARIELGQVFAADSIGIPSKLLFRAGGDDSVRGYAYQSLGPVVAGVQGGRVVATGGVELARPILASMPSLWGAVFVDAGNAAQSWRSFGTPAIGYGFGVRWRSPVGPLRVDIARAHETGRWRLGFSVGIAL